MYLENSRTMRYKTRRRDDAPLGGDIPNRRSSRSHDENDSIRPSGGESNFSLRVQRDFLNQVVENLRGVVDPSALVLAAKAAQIATRSRDYRSAAFQSGLDVDFQSRQDALLNDLTYKVVKGDK